MAGHIFVTGDTHRHRDIQKLSPDSWPLGTSLCKEDYLIVCGDFGLVWNGSEDDEWWQEWLDGMPWTTLFVDGNHENHDLLDAMPVERWHDGKVHFIKPSVIHLMRGQVYDICGQRIFAMGGASSHDIERRVPKISWWERELPSEEEYAEALANLAACGWQVDYIFSHEAPAAMVEKMHLPSWRYVEPDKHSRFLQSVYERCKFKGWYHGHYHLDRDTTSKIHSVYERILPLGDALTARPLLLYDLGRISRDFPWLGTEAAVALSRQPRGWGNIIFRQLRLAEGWAPAPLHIERVWNENGTMHLEYRVEGYSSDPAEWPTLMRNTEPFGHFWETCWHTCARCGAQADLRVRLREPLCYCHACSELIRADNEPENWS